MAVLTLKPLFIDPMFKGKTVLSSGDDNSPALVLLDDGETKGEVQFGNYHGYRIVGGAESNGFKIYSNDVEIMTLDDTGVNITGAIKCTDTANSIFALKGASGGGGSNNLILLHSNSEMGTSSNVYDDILDGTIIPDFTRHSPTLNVGLITRGIGQAQLKIIAQTLNNITLPQQIVLATISVAINPRGICFDQSGNMYVVNYGSNSVSKFSPSGNLIATITVGNSPNSVCSDPSGNIYITNYSGNSVSKILAGTTTVANTITVGSSPQGICSDPSGNIYVCNYGDTTVSKINAGATTVSNTITVGTNPYGVCSDTNGNIYVTNYSSASVSKILAGTTTVANTITVSNGPQGICIDPDGNIYVACYSFGIVAKILVGTIVVANTIPVTTASGICSDPSGNIYVTSYSGGTISKIKVGTINVANTTIVGVNPYGVCSDTNGNIYASSVGNVIYKIGQPTIKAYQDGPSVIQEMSLVNSPTSDFREVVKIDCSTLPDVSANCFWNILIQAKATSGDFIVKRFNMQSAPSDFMVGTTVINSNPCSIISSSVLSLLETKYFPINYAIDNSCVLRFLASVSNGAGVNSSEFKAVVTTTNGTVISANQVTLTASSSGVIQGYIDFPNIVAPTVKVEVFGRVSGGTGSVTLDHYELWLEV